MKSNKLLYIYAISCLITIISGCTDSEYKAYKEAIDSYTEPHLTSSKKLLADTTKKMHGIKFPNVNFNGKHIDIHGIHRPIILINDRDGSMADLCLQALNSLYRYNYKNEFNVIVNTALTESVVEGMENAYAMRHKIKRGFTINNEFTIIYSDDLDDLYEEEVNGFYALDRTTIFFIGKRNTIYRMFDVFDLQGALSSILNNMNKATGHVAHDDRADAYRSYLRILFRKNIDELLEYE